jgi:transcriptional regulator with XRE-family HTH domain
MLLTNSEILAQVGEAVRTRRVALGLSQEDAASRAGMGVRTWRRLERDGQATTETLVNAALVLRCEDNFAGLFPPLPAPNLDALLKQQAAPVPRRRASRRAAP